MKERPRVFDFTTLLILAGVCLIILLISACIFMPQIFKVLKSIFFPQEGQSGYTLIETQPKYRPPSTPKNADDLIAMTLGKERKSVIDSQDLPNDVFIGFELESGKPLHLPEKTLTQGLLNVGPPGRGKTRTFKTTMYRQLIARGNNTLIIFDGQKADTGDLISLCREYGRKYTILPMDGYNPLNTSETSVADIFEQTSGINAEGDAAYFLNKCKFFIQVVLPLFRKKYGMPITFDDLMLLCKSDVARHQLLKDLPPCDEKDNYELHFGGWKQQEFDKALDGLVMWLMRIPYGKNRYYLNQRNSKSMADLIEERQVIIIRAGGSKTNNFERALGLLFAIAIQDYVNKRDIYDLPFFLGVFYDEAHMYFNNTFPDFCLTCRKMRTGLFLGFQTFEQTEPFRDSILTGFQTWLVQTGLFEADARQVSMQIGERLYSVRQKSKSESPGAAITYSESETHLYESLWRPHHIQNLHPNHMLVLTVIDRKNVGPLEIVKPDVPEIEIYQYKEPEIAGAMPKSVFAATLTPENDEDQEFDKQFNDLAESHVKETDSKKKTNGAANKDNSPKTSQKPKNQASPNPSRNNNQGNIRRHKSPRSQE